MQDNEYYEYEDRYYQNPTLSSGEQEAFISNLRDIQNQNNAQISQQTYNLGTRVPSNLGGLGGGEAYFNSRYQTPQVNEMTATLKSAADAQALNDVMSNYQAQLKQKYNNAYKAAQKRAAARTATTTSGSTSGIGNNISVTDSSIGVSDENKAITSVPIEGHSTTSYYDGNHWVMVDETTGEKYIDGKLQSTSNNQGNWLESVLGGVWNTITQSPSGIFNRR